MSSRAERERPAPDPEPPAVVGQTLSALLILADDTRAQRPLAMLAEARRPSFDVIRVTGVDAAAILLRSQRFDVILFGLEHERTDGLEAISALAAVAPGTAIVVGTQLINEPLALRALHHGAQDCLFIDDPALDHARAVRAIYHAIARASLDANHQLDRMIAISPDAIMTVNHQFLITRFNAAAERMYGMAAEEAVGRRANQLPPANRRGSQLAFLRRVLSGESMEASEIVRRRRKDGADVILSASGTPITDVLGTVVEACVLVRDVTPLHSEQTARAHAEQQVRRAFDEALIGMALVDLQGRSYEINDALCRLLQRSRGELIGATLDRFTHPDHHGHAIAQWRDLLSKGELTNVAQTRFLLPDGRSIWAEVHASLIVEADGSPSHFVVQVQDITRRRREEDRLRDIAEHDELTGVLNRRGFDMALRGQVADNERHGAEGALLMVDLDNFKHHNDTYGHAVGDKILVAVASALSDHLRESDAVGRLGGDEFLVLMRHGGLEAAEVVAQMLLSHVTSAALAITGDSDRPITASIGIVCFAGAGQATAQQLMELADQAMYSAKRLGKNRYTVA